MYVRQRSRRSGRARCRVDVSGRAREARGRFSCVRCGTARSEPGRLGLQFGESNGGGDVSERRRGRRAASAISVSSLITRSSSASMRARFNQGDVGSQFKKPEVMGRSGCAFLYAAPPTSTYPGTRCRSVRDRHQTHSRERACFNQGDVDSQLKKPGVGPVQDARICAEGGGGDQPAPPPTDVSGWGQSLY